MLQPELSAELRERKIANIERVRPDVIATGNIGCITQIQQGTDIPVVHTVELLDWAYGGPTPRGLESLKDRVQDVTESEARTITAARPERRRQRVRA
jgi:glycolate oxidase iron-sulfur subunit